MGKMVTVVFVVLIGVVVFALMRDSFPDGGALRGMADGVRSVGRGIGDMFGGGYGAVTPG
ncbi:MAG: hypothetical protein ACRDU9_06485 [Acidimicrobiia bacterium]